MRKPAEFADFPALLKQRAPFGPYRARIKHVTDADSVDVLIDAGLNQYRYLTVRLAGVDAPELRRGDPVERARARLATERVRELVALESACVIETQKDSRSFGRYIAKVTLADGQDLGELLVAEGLAVPSRG